MKKLLLLSVITACISINTAVAIDRAGYEKRERERACHNVPDGGSTALLLGAGVLALGISKRKLNTI